MVNIWYGLGNVNYLNCPHEIGYIRISNTSVTVEYFPTIIKNLLNLYMCLFMPRSSGHSRFFCTISPFSTEHSMYLVKSRRMCMFVVVQILGTFWLIGGDFFHVPPLKNRLEVASLGVRCSCVQPQVLWPEHNLRLSLITFLSHVGVNLVRQLPVLNA